MRCIFGSPAARPCSIVGRGGLGTLSLHIYPSFFSVGVSNTLLEFLILQPSFFPSVALCPFLRRSPSFLVFDQGSIFAGGRCSSARSSAGRRFSRGPDLWRAGAWYALPLYLS